MQIKSPRIRKFCEVLFPNKKLNTYLLKNYIRVLLEQAKPILLSTQPFITEWRSAVQCYGVQ